MAALVLTVHLEPEAIIALVYLNDGKVRVTVINVLRSECPVRECAQSL